MKIKKFDIFIIFLFIISAFIFITFPQIDLKVSSLFFKEGVGFYLKNEPFVKFIYKSTIIIIKIFAISILILLILDYIFKKDIFGIKKRALIYLIVSLILGPGLIVNEIFKNHWGRARPIQINEFGGDKKFAPAFIKTNQCKKNCSFTSGHAAAAFYFISLVPLFRRKKEKIITAILALSWGSLVGLIRIIQGGHFLSDVIFSAFFVYFAARLSYYFILKRGDL
ncbi:phosphatase PAP2 family protein [Nitrosophilus kaiyonis]|uniref:phosphatase PAP2 family protein n=1 Tax=Nitrosophilus kaiyonis TaxID=2930200 RepID=UPI00249263D2|nr:phosphatase PAP2 family protein [Nitrosophilus kaiyonis]